MRHAERVAYLAGLVDGDGYLKIVKSQLSHGRWVYYHIQIGIQQLWPGEAVRLFAQAFGGKMMKPMRWREGRAMARCELHTRKAEAATKSLLPYLLVKREQALILLALCRVKSHRKAEDTKPAGQQGPEASVAGRSRFAADRLSSMEELREELLALHEGTAPDLRKSSSSEAINVTPSPTRTRTETLAYLAGIMDSDGNLRIERKKVDGMLSPHYRINIRASQVTPSPAIELLAITFGGTVVTVRPKQPHHRALASWSLHDGRAAAAIEELLPFLIVKRKEAELLLKLRALKASGKGGLTVWEHRTRWGHRTGMRKRCYTPEQVSEFERLHQAVKRLHSGENLGGLTESRER